MISLAPYTSRLWLVEPNRLHQLAVEASSYSACFSAKQIAKERRKQLALAMDWEKHLCGCSEGASLQSELAETKQIRAIGGGKKIGLIPVYGPVDQRMNSALMKAGGTSTEQISAALDVMLKEPSIGCIIMHMDSPGGSDRGLREVSDKIFNARQQKPVYAMIDSMMASAAYWMGSAASMVVCTPGGHAGSIGVYQLHMDQSKQLEQEGVKITVIKAGKYKAEGMPFEPLDDEAEEYMQSTVDSLYEEFMETVARNRGTTKADVRANYGDGRTMNASESLRAGLIDRVMTFEELLSRLSGSPANSSLRRAEQPTAEVLLLRHRHQMRLVDDLGVKKKVRA